MTPEKRIQNKIISFLKTFPSLKYERRQAGGFNYKSGLPDLWFLYKGKHVEVEVKAPGGYPTMLQLNQEKEFKDAGAYYWRDDNFDSFKNFFVNIFAEAD